MSDRVWRLVEFSPVHRTLVKSRDGEGVVRQRNIIFSSGQVDKDKKKERFPALSV